FFLEHCILLSQFLHLPFSDYLVIALISEYIYHLLVEEQNKIHFQQFPDNRKKADAEIVKAICNAPGRTKSFLDSIFQELAEKEIEDKQNWCDRSRILVINGSYNETEVINSCLNQYYQNIKLKPGAIKPLIRDNNMAEAQNARRLLTWLQNPNVPTYA
ncbi:MAG: hypothetical protein AAFW70_30225, partial [Cyanobacteria bacterium J06635_10]